MVVSWYGQTQSQEDISDVHFIANGALTLQRYLDEILQPDQYKENSFLWTIMLVYTKQTVNNNLLNGLKKFCEVLKNWTDQ